MLFNLFSSKKSGDTNETIDKKLKTSLITPYTDNNLELLKTDDGIDIVIGDNIKKSKYSSEISDNTVNSPQ
ncbi:MAG: hypothetical protein ACM3KR_03005 [Deltaproteobacteria bacterium]